MQIKKTVGPKKKEDTMKKTLCTLGAFLLLGGCGPEQPPSDDLGELNPAMNEPVGGTQSGAMDSSVAMEGQVVRIDTDAMILTLRTSSGETQEFVYTDSTEVEGRQSVAGLASETDLPIIVYYEEEEVPIAGVDSRLTATRIEFQDQESEGLVP